MKTESMKDRLSEKDWERFRHRAERVGLTTEELLESFVRDLIAEKEEAKNTEAFYINQWYSSHWFGAEPENKFLAYLLREYKIDEFFNHYHLRDYNRALVADAYIHEKKKKMYREDMKEAEQELQKIWNSFLQENVCGHLSKEEEFKKVIEHYKNM